MKALIWDIGFALKPNSGGPGGYLYNIHEYLKINNNDQVFFLSDMLGSHDNGVDSKTIERHNSLSAKLEKNALGKFVIDIWHLYDLYFNHREIIEFDFNQFDYIHFHSIYDIIHYSNSLSRYKGLVIATTHMPQPPIDEIIDGKIYNKSFFRIFRNLFIKREVSVCKDMVNLWIFPTIFSLEPYTSNSRVYEKYFTEFQENISYIPSSIMDREYTKEDNYFESINIPKDSYKIVYVGRHNEVKGYDELKQIGEHVLNTNRKVHFIIAGTEGPLYGLDDKNWHEIGFTTKAADIIYNANLFILPNKETYFDLVALEVLRAGTPILMSETGGNKYFKYELDNTEGIFFYKKGDVEEAVQMINTIMGKNEHNLRKSNRMLWESNFTINIFVSNYLNFLNTK